MAGKGPPPVAARSLDADPRMVEVMDAWLDLALDTLRTIRDDESFVIEPDGGQTKVHPLVKVAETATNTARLMAVELGRTPASAARVGASGDGGLDPLAEIHALKAQVV